MATWLQDGDLDGYKMAIAASGGQMADRDKHPEPLLAINPNTNKRLLDPGEPSNKRARPATRGPLKYLASKTSRRIQSALFEEINELSDVELSDDDDDDGVVGHVRCDSCAKWFLTDTAGLTIQAAAALPEWFCPKCFQNGNEEYTVTKEEEEDNVSSSSCEKEEDVSSDSFEVEDLGSDLGSNSQVFDGSALKAMENMLRDIPTLSWSGAIDLDARVQASWVEALAIAEKDALSFSDNEDILNPSSDDDDELLDELLALADPV